MGRPETPRRPSVSCESAGVRRSRAAPRRRPRRPDPPELDAEDDGGSRRARCTSTGSRSSTSRSRKKLWPIACNNLDCHPPDRSGEVESCFSEMSSIPFPPRRLNVPRRLNAPPLPPSHLLRGGARPPRAAAERVHEAYPDVVFIGVDEDESGEAARSVAQRFGLTFPVIHDENNVL